MKTLKTKTNMKPQGQVSVKLFDKDGNLKAERNIPNTVVSNGKNWIAKLIGGQSVADINTMAVGTSGVAVTLTDSNLGGEAGSATTTVSSPTANSVIFTADFPAGTGTGRLQEAGLFYTASDDGNIVARTTFDPIGKGESDSLTLTWTLTIS